MTDGPHLQPDHVSAQEGDSQTEFTDESPAVPTPVGPDRTDPDATTDENDAIDPDEKVTDPQHDVWAAANDKP